jgi:hypothetical protein
LRTTAANTEPRLWDYAVEHVIKVWNMRKCRRPLKTHCSNTPDETVRNVSSNPLTQAKVTALKGKHLRRYGCLAYFKPGVKRKDDHDDLGTTLRPKRKRGIHLGFSDNNSAWLIGTYDNGFKVYETRSVTFVEDILVKNVQELEGPEPPVFEQLLELANAKSGDGAVAGTERPSVAGTSANDRVQGLKEIEWEVSEESKPDGSSSGTSWSSAPPLDLSELIRKAESKSSGKKRKIPSTTEKESSGETKNLFSCSRSPNRRLYTDYSISSKIWLIFLRDSTVS